MVPESVCLKYRRRQPGLPGAALRSRRYTLFAAVIVSSRDIACDFSGHNCLLGRLATYVSAHIDHMDQCCELVWSMLVGCLAQVAASVLALSFAAPALSFGLSVSRKPPPGAGNASSAPTSLLILCSSPLSRFARRAAVLAHAPELPSFLDAELGTASSRLRAYQLPPVRCPRTRAGLSSFVIDLGERVVLEVLVLRARVFLTPVKRRIGKRRIGKRFLP